MNAGVRHHVAGLYRYNPARLLWQPTLTVLDPPLTLPLEDPPAAPSGGQPPRTLHQLRLRRA